MMEWMNFAVEERFLLNAKSNRDTQHPQTILYACFNPHHPSTLVPESGNWGFYILLTCKMPCVGGEMEQCSDLVGAGVAFRAPASPVGVYISQTLCRQALVFMVMGQAFRAEPVSSSLTPPCNYRITANDSARIVGGRCVSEAPLLRSSPGTCSHMQTHIPRGLRSAHRISCNTVLHRSRAARFIY